MPQPKRTATGVLGGLAGLIGLSAIAGVLVTATVTPAIAISSNAATGAITLFDNLPSYLEPDQLMLPTKIMYKEPGTENWAELTQFYDQNRSPVTYDEIAPVLYDAILSSEDPRYYQHGGVDLIGTTRAILSNAQGNQTQGGSSISQQYVKNILIQRCERDAPDDESRLACWSEATNSVGDEGIKRKVQEMRYAIALEQAYSKNDILLGYLNIANFGGVQYGIDAAARYYFNVPAKDLNLAQAATLAGMVQNPNTLRIDRPDGSSVDKDGNPINSAEDGYKLTKQRQSYVLEQMLEGGKITQAQHDEALEAPIEPKITDPKTGCGAAGGSAYFCQYVRYVIQNDPAFGATEEERDRALRQGGLTIYTTLDLALQLSAEQTMANNVPTSFPGINLGATTVSVDPRTGNILSIVQNTKFSEDAALAADPNYSAIVYAGDKTFGGSIGFNAGSTFKLFTLVEWLQQGRSLNEVLNGTIRNYPSFTNSCTGNWVNVDGWRPDNFGGGGGYVGTPMRFTAQSLNTGFFAMANLLDLCNIGKTATKMGVTTGDGQEITMQNVNAVIGSDNVSPLAMAAAYGTVANNGIYCEPRAISKIVDPNGEELPLPERTCEQVLDPAVAATAAYALQGVMSGGGTGSAGNPGDGTPLIGKTGTHQEFNTWLIESSTNVATAAWVGNSKGYGDLFRNYTANGTQLSQLRYALAREVMRTADQLYGGNPFPPPDSQLTRTVLIDLPNVIGQTIDQATQNLRNAGFEVVVGEPVDSTEGEGLVGRQDPGAGKVAGGIVVTINPSTGRGASVPNVVDMDPASAIGELNSAGFNDIRVRCEERGNAPDEGRVTRTDPAAGSVVSRDSRITVTVVAKDCGALGD